MATKSLVSATATLGIERRGGGQGREDPGIPGCHPRSRPRVPRLLPPPLAAAFAGLRGRPTRLGRPGAAGSTAAPHVPRRRSRTAAGRGEEERRRARQARPAGSARLRARPSSSAPASASCAPLRPSPPPGAPCTARPAAHRALSLPLPPGEARAQAHSSSRRG